MVVQRERIVTSEDQTVSSLLSPPDHLLTLVEGVALPEDVCRRATERCRRAHSSAYRRRMSWCSPATRRSGRYEESTEPLVTIDLGRLLD